MNKQELKDFVNQAHYELFTLRDTTALSRYFAENFIEHSPLVADGISGLAQLVNDSPQLQHQAIRILADGDLVAIHGRFQGLDEQPLVGFDIYRVDNGKIVEHWDGLVPEAAANSSGRTQLDGVNQVDTDGDIEKNRELVSNFFTQTLIAGDYSGFRRYAEGNHFLQHSPDIGDGVDAVIDFLEHIRDQGQGLVYHKIHRTIADGQFVLTHSEGEIAGDRHAYFELWRVENGKIAELWDAITAVPEDQQAVHPYGIF
ncbi:MULTISPECIES: nuclear transport factor 2 family protein [unclassified Acinetobacter]|uniref:nuclear transport factor 2 family protein n=1 Tax=unclassified Acinetobacter TaxID=196816 RepID=UPI002934AFE6|nr:MULTISPECIES: nuclear transport factor 2 family protein [unclassified Acinetobacter]WOE31538.1 nuclear transport factor 2 family protein [Acinetobacter sp. SAAs470]WOE39734.1 nuclear transport factor 2 family protein [Acinetobacter sp. SAAs474]